MNVFTAVIMDYYGRIKSEHDGKLLVTPEQQHWLESMHALIQARPMKRIKPASSHMLRAVPSGKSLPQPSNKQ